MPIVGVGTDLVSVVRFHRLIERGGRSFLDRWFGPAEVQSCLTHTDPAVQAATHFAAKEATVKALALRSGDGPPPWRDIEVILDEGVSPGLRLHGAVRDLATAAGVTDLHLTVAQDGRFATAAVVAARTTHDWAAPASPLTPRRG